MEGTTREERRPAGFRPARSLRLWLIAAAVLALLAVGTGAVATVVTRGKVHDSTVELNDHLRPAQSAAQRLLTAYVDEETGQRGFVLTGREAFLQPYRVGVRRAAALEDELTQLLQGRREALTLLADVKAAGVTWRVHARDEIETVRHQGIGVGPQRAAPAQGQGRLRRAPRPPGRAPGPDGEAGGCRGGQARGGAAARSRWPWRSPWSWPGWRWRPPSRCCTSP